MELERDTPGAHPVTAHSHGQRRIWAGGFALGGIEDQLAPVCPAVVCSVFCSVSKISVLESKQGSVLHGYREQGGILIHTSAVSIAQSDFELVDGIALADCLGDQICYFRR